MSEALPDDPDFWPDDPFEILGVARGSSDTDIKRAYTRLIRRFKPEHAPEAFRRVREAYDQCREQAAWYRTAFAEPAAEDVSPGPRPQIAEATGHESGEAPSRNPVADAGPTFHTAVNPAETLWELAAEGRDADAYAGLTDLAAVGRDGAELPLRLYWLLALNPSLDTARTRHDWLAAALVAGGLSGPAAELYRRELDTDPAAALGIAYDGLLTAPASADDVLALLRGRVAAAGRLKQPRLIERDLIAANARLTRDTEAGWLWLLVAVKEWLAGLPDATAADFLPPLFEGLRHLELPQSAAFDRAEFLDGLTRAMHLLYDTVPPELLALVRTAAVEPSEVRASDADAAAVSVGTGAVKDLLRKYDTVFDRSGATVLELAVAGLTACARRVNWHGDEDLSEDILRSLARRLPDLDDPAEYRRMRPAVIRLLLDNDADLNELAAACDDDPDVRVRHFAKVVREDLVLRFLWLVLWMKQQSAPRRAKVVGAG